MITLDYWVLIAITVMAFVMGTCWGMFLMALLRWVRGYLAKRAAAAPPTTNATQIPQDYVLAPPQEVIADAPQPTTTD